MKIDQAFIEGLIKKRKSSFKDLLNEDNLNLSQSKLSPKEIISSLDRIFYTIEFLERNNLITIRRVRNNHSVTLFNGIPLDKFTKEDIGLYHYYMEKLDFDYLNELEIKPGLILYRENNFKTDEEVKNKRENSFKWIAVTVSVFGALVSVVVFSYGIRSDKMINRPYLQLKTPVFEFYNIKGDQIISSGFENAAYFRLKLEVVNQGNLPAKRISDQVTSSGIIDANFEEKLIIFETSVKTTDLLPIGNLKKSPNLDFTVEETVKYTMINSNRIYTAYNRSKCYVKPTFELVSIGCTLEEASTN